MTPEYLRDLADSIDCTRWRLPLFEQLALSPRERQKLDIGVALRRHASDVERLNRLLGTGKSLVLTPLAVNTVRVRELEV